LKPFLVYTKVFLILVFCASCANLDTVATAPTTTGISRNFSDDHELIKAAVLASMQNLNINIKSSKQTPDGFIILFTKAISAFSWGEVGRVLVSKVDNNNSTVFVHSNKRYQLQITGSEEEDFAEAIFQGVTEILEKKKK